MTEAWLLIDADAIRHAVGNPNGTVPIELPRPHALERVPNPKALLREALVAASEYTSPRRRKRFQRDIGRLVQNVASRIRDFSPLDSLEAYRAFEDDLRVALEAL